MDNKKVNIFYILLPVCLLVSLMTIALINYPVIFNKAKNTVIIDFLAAFSYLLTWSFIKPDRFSKNGGLWIGFLFIVNISIEEFINWQTKALTLISTLTMMSLIFITFSVISAIKTLRTKNSLQGIRSSFISAILGTVIALCFGFLIDFIFSERRVNGLKNYPGYDTYKDPIAFTYYNSFDNASNHVIFIPIVSLIMGTLGGAIGFLILRIKYKAH